MWHPRPWCEAFCRISSVRVCFQLVDKTRIVIVPSLNPDGREIAQEGDCSAKLGQSNVRGKDLDTDFTSKANCFSTFHAKPCCSFSTEP